VKANFEITDDTGNVVDTYEDIEKPFVWNKYFEKPGLYIITAFVTEDFGAVSEPSRINARFQAYFLVSSKDSPEWSHRGDQFFFCIFQKYSSFEK